MNNIYVCLISFWWNGIHHETGQQVSKENYSDQDWYYMTAGGYIVTQDEYNEKIGGETADLSENLINAMTKKELLAVAKKYDIEVDPNLKVGEIREIIIQFCVADGGANDDTDPDAGLNPDKE